MIHQRAGWIEDIEVHGDNFFVAAYVSRFLLTFTVYNAFMAGFEV